MIHLENRRIARGLESVSKQISKRLPIVALLIALTFHPRPALAMSADVRTVLLSSLYGLVGGTALGAVAYPVHQSVRGIFICSSIGMYLGAATGIYLVHNWDEFEGEMRRGSNQATEPRWVQAHLEAREWGSLKPLTSAESGFRGPAPSVTFQF